MKRIFFFLIFVMLVSGAYPLEFKILGGIDLSKSTEPFGGVWSEVYPVAKYGAGAILGGGIEFPLTQNIALEVDGFYFQKGCRLELKYFDVVIGHKMERMNELSFPVLLKICLRPGTSPYLLGGGEFAFVLSNGPKRTDYGLVFGVGFRKQLKRTCLSIEGRYHHGFQDTLTDSSILRKMRVFALMVGISI